MSSPRNTVTACPLRTTRSPWTWDPHHAAACGRLIGHEGILVEALAPKRTQAAVGGAGWVLIDACPRSKIARDKVKAGGRRTTRDDGTLHRERLEEGVKSGCNARTIASDATSTRYLAPGAGSRPHRGA